MTLQDKPTEVPLYQSKQQVRAARVVSLPSDGLGVYVDIGDGLATLWPQMAEWMAQNNPQPGGYVIQSGDDRTYVTAEAFENAYQKIEPTLQEKLSALDAAHELIDLKLRDGEWWLRAVKTVMPRNSSLPTDKVEVTGATLEECVDKVMSETVQ